MVDSIRHLVRARAKERCEYCHLPQKGHEERFSFDHIVSRKHGGEDHEQNLALSCLRCNLYKGTDLTSLDPATDAVVPLFNPRRDTWLDHFRWNGPILIGTTPIGRATVALMRTNAPERVQLRQALLVEGILSLD